MKSEWYACNPCQICNEESQIICMCTRVYLCENCLAFHLLHEVSSKHKPQLLENCSARNDQSEAVRQEVINAIKSKLQNEVLLIEEFKRISVQTISDFIESIEKDLKEICEKFIRNIEEKCSQADQDLRNAISLSKLSLNVNHPILDLFKTCKSLEQVKNVDIVSKKLEFRKLRLQEVIDDHTTFALEIYKDMHSRILPLRSPAEAAGKDYIKKSQSTIYGDDDSLADISETKDYSRTFSDIFTYKEESSEKSEKSFIAWKSAETQSTSKKTYIEMELQERPKAEAKPIKVMSDYEPLPLFLYKAVPYTEEIISLNVNNSQCTRLSLPGQKFFPGVAWAITEDEKLLFSGGFDGSARNSSILYNLITQKSEKSSSMIYPRYNHALVSCGKYIYAIGGKSLKILKECERFSLQRKDWAKIGLLNIGREHPGVCVHSNKIYICGGNGIESFEVFNPSTNKFALLSLRLPSPGRCCLFPYDSDIYILQKSNLFKVNVPKMSFSTIASTDLNEWWSPCDPQVTHSSIFFCTSEGFYRISLDTYSITLINFISK